MTKVYQMLWDCQFCGTAKLLAKTQRACPKCKAPQNPARRYFPSEADMVEVRNYKFQGKDRLCLACNGLNIAKANFCQSCGGSLTEANALSTQLSSGRGDGTFAQKQSEDAWNLEEQVRVAEAELAKNWPEETPEATLQRLQQKPLRRGPSKQKPLSQGRSRRTSRSLFAHSSPIEKLALGVMGCLGCAIYGPMVIGALLTTVAIVASRGQEPSPPIPTVPLVLRVTGHRWQRTVNIETYKPITKSGWESNLPRDANYVKLNSCEARERETDDGDTVTASYCTYSVNRWQSDDQVIASGDSVETVPHWPTPDFKTCDYNKLGCKQEGARSETYTLRLIDPVEDKQHTCNVSYDLWKNTAIGTQVKIMSKLGSAPSNSDCAQMTRL